ncbi:MAG: S-layer homology domain-containing protein [Firmicutes bacterium]|nr:S-layer homology domain-containing protein [Bacillota bacterium]
MYEKSYISGIGEGKFGPNLSTERGMIVTILYRMEGSPKVDFENLYSDVKEGEWYSDAVIWASSEDIAAGYPEGDFRPNQIVSRQELARFIYKYAEYKGYDLTKKDDLSKFTDSSEVGSWARECVEWAVGTGLISGMGNGKLAPRDTATRAQLAAILNRLSKMTAVTPAPVDEKPAEEEPAEETPVAETPAEEAPAEETPASETPAEEVTAG